MTTQPPLLRSIAFVLLASATAAVSAQTAAQLPADLDSTSLARLPYLERKDVDEAGQKIFDIFDRSPGRTPEEKLSGPLAFAAYNVPVAQALLDLHDAAVGKGTLNPHVRELAILVASRATDYNLEWNAHQSAALEAGVDAKVIAAVRSNAALTGIAEQDAAVIRFGRELLQDRKMSSATFAKAVELFGEHGAMDLVAVMLTYAVSGFYAIAVDEHMPAGQPTLERLAK
jgi:4-carboxymuconolactone decarboxylase